MLQFILFYFFCRRTNVWLFRVSKNLKLKRNVNREHVYNVMK